MRRKLTIGFVLGVLLLAVPASATDTFPDVPAESTHHDAVAELAHSGVTLGCGSGNEYCPHRPVQRDQMATFLTRGGSRGAFDQGTDRLAAVDGGLGGVAASATTRTSGGEGGRSTALVQGTVTVFSEDDTVTQRCPCEVEAFVYRVGGEEGPSSWAQLPAEPTEGGQVNVAVPVSWGVELPAEQEATFRVAVFVNDEAPPDDVRVDGSLSVVTAPFGEAPQG